MTRSDFALLRIFGRQRMTMSLCVCYSVSSFLSGFTRAVMYAKFKDMLFFRSWKHVHVRLHCFDCFQMCAASSQTLFPSFSLSSPAGLYLTSNSSPLSIHPSILLSSASCVSSALCTNTTFMAWIQVVCVCLIATLDPNTSGHSGQFAFLRWSSTVKQLVLLSLTIHLNV